MSQEVLVVANPFAKSFSVTLCSALSRKMFSYVSVTYLSIPFTICTQGNCSRNLNRSVTSEQESASIIRNCNRIHNTFFGVSSFSPYNVIVHWHEDDPACELLKFTLWFLQHLLNLFENAQCSESWEYLPFELHRHSVSSIQTLQVLQFVTSIALSHSRVVTRKKWRRNLLRPEIQEILKVLKLEAENVHIIFTSPASVPHMEKIYPILRQVYGRSPTDDLNDFDVNNAIWVKIMKVTLQAAVHLGRGLCGEIRFTMNQLLKSVKQLFQMTEKSWSWIRQKSVVWPWL